MTMAVHGGSSYHSVSTLTGRRSPFSSRGEMVSPPSMPVEYAMSETRSMIYKTRDDHSPDADSISEKIPVVYPPRSPRGHSDHKSMGYSRTDHGPDSIGEKVHLVYTPRSPRHHADAATIFYTPRNELSEPMSMVYTSHKDVPDSKPVMYSPYSEHPSEAMMGKSSGMSRIGSYPNVAGRSPYAYSSRVESPAVSSREEALPIKIHPLIIGHETVICMPEVNRVLRNVYQVLSQANYYLSKHGISSRRYTGAQLIRIKMLGILGHDAKVCSYILQADAERIFDSFDTSGSCHKSPNIVWSEPIMLDENPTIHVPKTPRSPAHKYRENENPGPVDVHLFRIGGDVIVCAPDVQKVIQTHFNQGATTGYYFSKLGIVPYKFVHPSHLDKVKELGIIKRTAVHCTYIMKSDALRVFAAYGMSDEDIETKINWLEAITLSESPSLNWSPSLKFSIKKEDSPSMIGKESPTGSPTEEQLDGDSVEGYDENGRSGTPASSNGFQDDAEVALRPEEVDMTVNVFVVEKQEVVCMPDIHKVVQAIHGNSIQVNYYFSKLHVKKRRFCFAHLRELKNRKILQGNATYCTYVAKTDAEKLFQIYCLIGDPKLSDIKWKDPIDLDQESYGDSSFSNDMDVGDTTEDCLPINTFSVDGALVVTTPDVNRIVDYLGEQSASLDYHFRKLGIQKMRFSYSQLHQLRRMQVIRRPTVCTFIYKTDTDRLLKMYSTDRNRLRMSRLKFLEPIVLISSENASDPNSPRDRPDVSREPKHRADGSPVHAFMSPVGSSYSAGYASNDFYKTYREENLSHNGYDHSERRPTVSRQHSPSSPPCPTASTAMAHIRHIHPNIDCPIVIPNGDFDPTMIGTNNVEKQPPPIATFGRTPSTDADPLGDSRKRALIVAEEEYSKRMRGDPNYTQQQLVSDLNRKEIELRLLHNAYQRELDSERQQRVQLEKKMADLTKSHDAELTVMSDRLVDFEKDIELLRGELRLERKNREKLEGELHALVQEKSNDAGVDFGGMRGADSESSGDGKDQA